MKAKIIKFKNKNQIYTDFKAVCKEALDTFNIDNWEVRQLEQLFKTNILTPSIYLSIVTKKQLGRQYKKNSRVEETFNKTKFTKQEITIRFSASRRELASDILNTYSGVDILSLIREFIQSTEGTVFLNDMGYAQYAATQVTEQSFINDSDNFQFRPYFDCTFLYTDSWTTEVSKIDKVKGNIYKV